MDTLSKSDLKTLIADEGELHISIYMPTHKVVDQQQDPIRLKRLLDDAEERMVQDGLRSSDAQELLQPARDLLKSGALFESRTEGLALFISPLFFRHYRVPLAPEEMVMIGKRFWVEPLLPLLAEAEQGTFFILALSLNEVRLFRATHHTVREIELPEDMPESLAQAMKYDDFEMQHGLYSGTPGWSGGVPGAGGEAGKAGAVFYGQEVGSDLKKDNILRYFQQVDRGVQTVLRRERAPLVLAGVDYLLPIYEEVNSYKHLFAQGIEGNPDDMRPEELRDSAWSILQPLFAKAQYEALEQYKELAGTGRTCTGIKDLVQAAYGGQVDTLFIAGGTHQWPTSAPSGAEGTPLNLQGTEQQEDEELLNDAAVHTLLNDGTIYVVEQDGLPGGIPAAAILRF